MPLVLTAVAAFLLVVPPRPDAYGAAHPSRAHLRWAFPQVAVLVAMVPFNATLLHFAQTEMVGHLPVYGVFLALP